MTTLVAYVAAPHAGYLALFRKYAGGVLYILGRDFIADFKPLVRNLPAPTPEEVQAMVRSLGIFLDDSDVRILTKDSLREVLSQRAVVLPDEDVSRAMAQRYFAGMSVAFDGSWRLRWDWGASQKNERPAERLVSALQLDQELITCARREAERSSDWWRQVGALLARDGKPLITAYNKHMPSEHTAYLCGDPRSNAEQGVSIEVSIASHAERRVQAIAAREGIATFGCDLYVTTYPCPPCAYAWAESGIRRLYYADGYSALEGTNALVAHDIEIVRVEMQPAPVPT